MKIIFGNEQYNIPVIPQWEEYRYEPMLKCQCKSTEHGHNIVGIAEVQGAMMVLHECPYCCDKFRCHIALPHDEWEEYLGLMLHLHNQKFRIN